MKRLIILIILSICYKYGNTQHLHKDNPITMSVGHGGIMLKNINQQELDRRLNKCRYRGEPCRYD